MFEARTGLDGEGRPSLFGGPRSSRLQPGTHVAALSELVGDDLAWVGVPGSEGFEEGLAYASFREGGELSAMVRAASSQPRGWLVAATVAAVERAAEPVRLVSRSRRAHQPGVECC